MVSSVLPTLFELLALALTSRYGLEKITASPELRRRSFSRDPPTPGVVRLHVKSPVPVEIQNHAYQSVAKAPRLRFGGTLSLAMGSAAIGVGLVLTVGGAFNMDTPAQVSSSGLVLRLVVVGSGNAAEAAGIVLLSIGGAAVIGGVVAMSESRTKIQLHPAGASRELSKTVKPRYWAGEF